MLGAGSIPEELFRICRRRDCETVKMLRHRAMRDVLRSGASANPTELLIAVKKAIRRIEYAAEDVRGAVVEEYARLISLDVPLNEETAALLGGRPGQTLEELIYRSSDPLVNAFHTVAMALYMEYVDRPNWQRLEVFDFAAYTALTLLQRGRATRNRAANLLGWITDQVLAS
jgi:hypothetical protein